MTQEQIEMIRQAREEMLVLVSKQDQIFDQIVKDIGFKMYADAWANSKDPSEIVGKNPIGWLTDLMYNVRDAQHAQKQLERMIEAKKVYDIYYGNV
jgi:hypothetical protein